MQSTRTRERELRTLVSGKKKNSLPVNYELATLYYDRRMLTVGKMSLVRCRELAGTMRGMVASRCSTARAAVSSIDAGSQRVRDRQLDEITASFHTESEKAEERLRGIEADICHVSELQSVYSTLTPDVPVLPCLLSRFTEHVIECEQWWREVRSSPLIDWNN